MCAVVALTCTIMCGCGNSRLNNASTNDLDSIMNRGELRVLTLSGSTSYFYYKGEERGYEYELIKHFADDMGLTLRVIVAPNIAQLTTMLNDTIGDVIAYDCPITS